MSLVGFGVKNLRCLTDTGIVPLKPLTLLVGKNSSGKSTFLRAFPLLRQSVENARSSPILWHHPDYVDFGALDLAINDAATERSVTFEFAAEWSDDGYLGRGALRMEIAASESGPYVRSYDLSTDEQQARLEFDAEHRLLRIDGKPDEATRPQDLWLGGVAYLVASLREGGGGRLNYQPYIGDPFTRIANTRISWPGGAEEDAVPLIGRALSYMDTDIAPFMYGVTYLGPQRAVAARAYRLDDVAVEEVNAQATNMAKFLASLPEAEMQGFCAFTRRYLDFETAVRIQGVSGEILVKEPGGNRFVNIADVGFGYSEVLPLCATLWSSCVREPSPKRRQASLLALEQPELHLHPGHQARLPRMLVGALLESRRAGREVKLMVETHSHSLVNELGMVIRRKRISHEDAQILFFDPDDTTRQTTIVRTGYRPDGVLRENWPFGFLAGGAADDEDDLIELAAAE